MRTVVLDEHPAGFAAFLDQRRRLGQDRFDEVWEGEYHVVPGPNGPHGDLDSQLVALLRPRARAHGLWGHQTVNIGRLGDYRVPDQSYLRERAQGAFTPTAAIVVEVVSPGDETYDKLDFYFARGVEELLIVDPRDRTVQWYARGTTGFERSGRSQLLDLTADDLHAAIDWPPGE